MHDSVLTQSEWHNIDNEIQLFNRSAKATARKQIISLLFVQ